MKRMARPFFRWPVLLAVVLALILLASCGGRRTYPVEGQVVFTDGVPLSGGFVQFEPKDPEAPPVTARGEIQENGTFRLSTFKEGDGALEGEHRALITPPLSGGDFERGNVPDVIHPKYKRLDTSGLEFKVTSDRSQNIFRIEIERPPHRQ
jgi:hypothetical protein